MELQERQKLGRLRALLQRQLENAKGATAQKLEAQIKEIDRQLAEAPPVREIVESGVATAQSESAETDRKERWADVRDLVAAPYRFVPLNKEVVPPEIRHTPLDLPQPGHGSATLTVTWGIETPLLIGQPEGDDENSAVSPLAIGNPRRWVIPGATLRGLVRSSLEIIAFARLRPVNDHFRFGLRDFTHARYQDESPVSKDSEVRAGWLEKVDEKYRITPCARAGEGWGYVEITSLSGGEDPAKWSRLDRSAKLQCIAGTATHFVATTPRSSPNGGVGRMVYAPEKGGEPGELVVSDKAVGTKRYEYVFFADPTAKPVTINDRAWYQFELMNCRQGRTRLEPDGAWKYLKEKFIDKGKRVPVFWVGALGDQSKDFAFGITRLFKIPHSCSVGDKIPCELRPRSDASGRPDVDLVENLFGYVYEQGELRKGGDSAGQSEAAACRSRIAFGFAKPVDPAAFAPWPERGHHETIMMAPRASYAPYYLVGREKDWSSRDSQLAGRKRYPPRYRTDKLANAEAELRERLVDPIDRYEAGHRLGKRVEDSVRTKVKFLRPVRADAAFGSTIKMHNVSEIELGAVLWALTFGGGTNDLHRHMLGRAKGMGAGQTAVRRIGIVWRQHDKDEREKDEWPGGTDGLAARMMRAFEKYMEDRVPQWRSSETIEAYLKLHGTGTWSHLAGKLAEAMGAAPTDKRARVVERSKRENGLANSFLQRPDPVDSQERKTTNDFQRLREVTKRARKGIKAPEAAIPERLLTIPDPPAK